MVQTNNMAAEERAAFSFRRNITRVGAAVACALSLTACAVFPADPEDRYGYYEANDPIEGINRAVYGFNEAVDILILNPIAVIYRDAVPGFLRDGVDNFLTNLRSPSIFANQVLQGDLEGAEVTAARFLTNTAAGLGGFLDVAEASDARLTYEQEDFGQTLGVWGIEEGPYIVLPLLGPGSTRDNIGRLVDNFLLDPLNIVWMLEDEREWMYFRSGAEVLNKRSQLIEAIDDIRANSLDPYASTRSAYRQNRNAAIADGEVSGPDIPDFDE